FLKSLQRILTALQRTPEARETDTTIIPVLRRFNRVLPRFYAHLVYGMDEDTSETIVLADIERTVKHLEQVRAKVIQESPSATGTGFIISPSGYVLTAGHVSKGCQTLGVRHTDTIEAPERIVEEDTDNDLSLLKINPSQSFASFRSLNLPEKF